MNEQEQIKQLESEGLQNVAVRAFKPNAVLPEHTHEKPTLDRKVAALSWERNE